MSDKIWLQLTVVSPASRTGIARASSHFTRAKMIDAILMWLEDNNIQAQVNNGLSIDKIDVRFKDLEDATMFKLVHGGVFVQTTGNSIMAIVNNVAAKNTQQITRRDE